MKILIPTYLDREQIEPLIRDIEQNSPGHEVFASCTKASASVNRNICLDQINVGDIAIMVDDDIRGFTPGWAEDLVYGLSLPNAVMVSARLLNPDGTFGPTCSECYAAEPMEIEVFSNGECLLPSAAISFRHLGHKFDTSLKGSGFDDGLFCAEYLNANPNATFWQTNRARARLIHLNQMKEQKGPNWHHNRNHFWTKWPKGMPGPRRQKRRV